MHACSSASRLSMGASQSGSSPPWKVSMSALLSTRIDGGEADRENANSVGLNARPPLAPIDNVIELSSGFPPIANPFSIQMTGHLVLRVNHLYHRRLLRADIHGKRTAWVKAATRGRID